MPVLNKFLLFGWLLIAAVMPLHSAERITGENIQDEEWSIKLSGYYKNLLMYQKSDNFHEDIIYPPVEKKIISDLNRLSLSPELSYRDSFILQADVDVEGVFTNYNESAEFDLRWKETDYNDLFKPSCGIADNKHLYSRAGFRNIYAKITAGSFTGTVGRQQVRFGSSRLWNPLDIMNPLDPVSIEGADEQKGTDALRIDWYPDDSTELTGVVSPGRENDRYEDMVYKSSDFVLRLKSGIKEFDWALLAGYTSRRKNFGTDFAAEVNDGLLTGVILYSVPDNGESYYQCGSGYEYTFSGGIYLLVEYFYNSLPVNESDELRSAVKDYAVSGIDQKTFNVLSNRVITYNRNYLSFVIGYDFFPLLRGELFSIYDFRGRGIFINASIKLNAAENLDITAGVVMAYTGGDGEVSDFTDYESDPMFYASLKFYF